MPTIPPSVTKTSKLLPVANVLMGQLNMAIVTIGSFVITPRILNALGDSAYGGWLLVSSIVLYIRMLDMGVSTGAMKFGAGAEGRGDESDLARVFNTTAAIFLAVGVVALVLALGMVFVLPRLYPNILGGESQAILLLGVSVAVDLACRTYAAALRARSLFFVHDFVEIVTYSIFKLALVLYFARVGLSYRILALLNLGDVVVRNILVIGAALRVSPAMRHLRPDRPDLGMLKKIGSMGGQVTLLRIADIIRFQVDAAVIGYWMPGQPQAISVFGIGARLVSIAYMVVGVIGGVMVPRFSQLSERRDESSLAALLARTSLITSLATSYVLVNVAVFGPGFLELWLNKPWVGESGRILLILTPAYFVALLSGSAGNLLVARGKLNGHTIITIAEGAANFVLSVILIGPLGIYGVALGTAIPMVLARGVAFPILVHRVLGIRPWEYFRMNGRGVVVGAIYLAAVFGLGYVPLTSYGRFVALGLASTAVFVALLCAFVPEARAAAGSAVARMRALAKRIVRRGQGST